jgi:hypothetical protein
MTFSPCCCPANRLGGWFAGCDDLENTLRSPRLFPAPPLLPVWLGEALLIVKVLKVR